MLREVLLLCGSVMVFPWLQLFILVSRIVMLFWNKWVFLSSESETFILFLLMWLQELKIGREVHVERSVLVLTTNFYHKMCLYLENSYSENTALLCIPWIPAHLQNQATTFSIALCCCLILGNRSELLNRRWWRDQKVPLPSGWCRISLRIMTQVCCICKNHGNMQTGIRLNYASVTEALIFLVRQEF